MAIIITKKTIEKEEAKRRAAQELFNEHHRLAIEHSMLLDFVYLAASSKRRDGKYNNSREALQAKAGEVLSKINL